MKISVRRKPKHPAFENKPKPVLHLDGRHLRGAFENMVKGADKFGGIETVIDGLTGKSLLFQATFKDPTNNCLFESDFYKACTFMPTVRRRLKFALKNHGFERIERSIHSLLNDVSIENVDARVEQMSHSLADSRKDRWIRDFAAEILHFCEPEKFPLMTHWVWNYHSNTGVLREIWFSDSEVGYIDIQHSIETHLELRREILGFLSDCGVYANLALTVDVFFAWIYSEYIGSQGGSFLRTDFSFNSTPFGYTLRMLGLDAALSTGQTRLLLPNGKRFVITEPFIASTH